MPIAVEDKFIVFAIGKGRLACPGDVDSFRLASMVSRLDAFIPVFDLRELEYCYDDSAEFLSASLATGSSV